MHPIDHTKMNVNRLQDEVKKKRKILRFFAEHTADYADEFYDDCIRD